MGGCRCSFRQCTNSSYNSRNTHFFHYPIKDSERCTKWIKCSNNPSFSTLPSIKLRNKVVCDKHFDNNSFMNYKRDRLVHDAVPTMNSQQSRGKIENAIEITSDQLFMENHSESDFTLPQSNTDNTKLTVTDRGSSGLLFSDNKEDTSIIEVVNMLPLNKEQLFNINSLKTVTVEADESQYNIFEDSMSAVLNEDLIFDLRMQSDECINTYNKTKNETESLPIQNTSESVVQQIVQSKGEEVRANNLKLGTVPRDNIQKNQRKIMSQLKYTRNRNKMQCKQNIAPVTKEQLFQGIKKYLSTSMEVLLRMELFGSLDREWQPDEKELSVEFLKFGSDVYSYMTDELRWRLPSPSLVKQWQVALEEENELEQMD